MHANQRRVFRELPVIAEALDHFLQPVIADAVESVGHAEARVTVDALVVHTFDDVRVHLETRLREQHRENSAAHAMADVEGLAHGAHILAHARALRRGKSECHAQLHLVKIHHARAGGSDAHRAEDAVRMPAVIDQLGAQPFGYAGFDFKTHDERVEHARPPEVQLLGDGK